MFESIYPYFVPGRVLKKRSIEFLRDFPHDLLHMAFDSYSDGILFGFSIHLENGYLTVSKGAVKYKGQIIVIPENKFVFEDYARLLHIKLVMSESRIEEDWESRLIELKLDPDDRLAINEFELGRFVLARGAVLRCEYDSIIDFSTQHNTLDITHVRFAGVGAPTLHPKILSEFARVILKDSNDPADLSFGFMCLNVGIVHKESIERYLSVKNGRNHEVYTLENIYGKLSEIASQKGRWDAPNPNMVRRTPIIS